MTLIDQTERQMALDPMQSWIVSAPAGSGKTYLLTRRILNLFMHVSHPSHVVAITFTKKAAHEMQERLIGCLKQPEEDIAKAVLARNEKLGWDILNNPNALSIMTIDSYCGWLLSHSKEPLNVPVSQSAERLYHDVIYQYFQNKYWSASQKTLLAAFNGQYMQLEKLLISLLATRDQWLEPLKIKNLALLCKQGIQDISHDHINKLNDIFKPHQDDINTLFTLHEKISKHLHEDIIYIQAKCVKKHYLTCADILLTKSGTFRKSFNKRQGIYPKSRIDEQVETMQNAFKAIIERLSTSLTNDDIQQLHNTRILPCDQTVNETSLLKDLSNVLTTLLEQLEIYFYNHQLCDFSAIALSAIDKLKHDTELQSFCKNNIYHLLIDEFQDTSSTQYALLKSLINTWPKASHRTLFAVGDPMQSIYRFRQADVKLFMQLQNNAIQHIDPKPISLQCNFRSSSKIIGQINAMFNDVFPSENIPNLGAIQYSQATPTQPESTDHGIYLYHEENETPGAQATHCVHLINQLLAKYPGERIAVLVQARSHLKHIIPLLENHDISFNAVDIYPTVNLSSVQDLTALISALIDPFDTLSWYIVLRSPLCGITLNALDKIPKAGNTYDHLKQLKLEGEDQALLDKLLFAINEAIYHESHPVTQVWRIWCTLLADQIYPKNQKDAINNWFELVNKRVSEGHPIHREALLAYFARSFTSRTHPDARVSLLTAHKSKGLEYEHVIIPHLEKRKPPASTPLFYCETASTPIIQPTFTDNLQNNHYFKQLNKQRDYYENMRLFYVACTRAKYTLHLLTQAEESPAIGSWLDGLTPHLTCNHNITVYSQHTEMNTDKKQHTIPLCQTLASIHHPYEKPQLPTESQDARIGTALHYYAQHITHPHRQHKWQYYLSTQRFNTNELKYLQRNTGMLLAQLNQCSIAKWVFKTFDWERNEFSLYHLGKHYIIDRVFLEEDTYHIIDFKFPKTILTDKQLLSQYKEQLIGYKAALSTYIDRQLPIKTALYLPLENRLIIYNQD